ncbi:MAG: hypothetical protein ABGY96_20795 [bacterium]
MFKLIALAMHFSPHTQGPLDPTVIEMLRRELNPQTRTTDEIDESQPVIDEPRVQEAA